MEILLTDTVLVFVVGLFLILLRYAWIGYWRINRDDFIELSGPGGTHASTSGSGGGSSGGNHIVVKTAKRTGHGRHTIIVQEAVGDAILLEQQPLVQRAHVYTSTTLDREEEEAQNPDNGAGVMPPEPSASTSASTNVQVRGVPFTQRSPSSSLSSSEIDLLPPQSPEPSFASMRAQLSS